MDAHLCFALYKSTNKVGRLYRHHLQPLDLTFPLYLSMVALWERAPCKVGDVAQALDLETNTVTPLMKRLEALGYVTRERDVADERKVMVALTDRGRALQDATTDIRADFLDRSGVGHDKVEQLRTALHLLSSIVDGLMPPKRPSTG